MSLISLKNFSHNYGDKPLFDGADFVLNKGEKIGVIGVNGAGKSTLLKLITGQLLLDKGTKEINPKHLVKYLDQHAEIEQEISIREYLMQAFNELHEIENQYNEINHQLAVETNPDKLEKLMYKSGDLFEILHQNNYYNLNSEVEKVATGLGVSAYGLDNNVNKLSGGQRAKVILAKLLLENPDVMILDEPTNFLDTEHIDWLKNYIINNNKSFVVVSHDYKFLNEISTHICDVDNYKIVKYTGNVDASLAIKEQHKMQLEKGYESQQREIKKLEDYISRNKARASTARMAQSRVKKLEKMDVINPPLEKVKPIFSFKYKPFVSNQIIKADNLIVGYNKPLLSPISFIIENGDKVAITGFNGVGKSTLLKTLLGVNKPLGGYIEVHKNIEFGYYEQEHDFHSFIGTPINYVQQFYPKLNENQVRTALSQCGLNAVHVRKQIAQLSGGEQSKTKLCNLILTPTNLLILDEPTNHLDVLAIERLKEAILEFEGTVVFVSHDKQFVSDVATKIVSLEKYIK